MTQYVQVSYTFLGHTVQVHTDSPALWHLVHDLWHPFAAAADSRDADLPELCMVVETQHTGGYALICNGQPVCQTATVWHLFWRMAWHVNRFVGEVVRTYFLLHAGAVVLNGAGVLLPAPSGYGKTSLTLALLLRGHRYFSDEFAVINPATGLLHAFPKPLTIKDDMLFPDLHHQQRCRVSGPPPGTPQAAWHVLPADVGHQAADQSVPVRAIIFPRYDATAHPHIQPLAAGRALRLLFEHAFNALCFGQQSLHIATRLVRQARCFVLTTNDLAQTAEIVEKLF